MSVKDFDSFKLNYLVYKKSVTDAKVIQEVLASDKKFEEMITKENRKDSNP